MSHQGNDSLKYNEIPYLLQSWKVLKLNYFKWYIKHQKLHHTYEVQSNQDLKIPSDDEERCQVSEPFKIAGKYKMAKPLRQIVLCAL